MFWLKLWLEHRSVMLIPSRNATSLTEMVLLIQWSWPPREKVLFLASQLRHPAIRSMAQRTTGQQHNLCLQRLSGNVLVFTSAMEGQLWRGLTTLLWPWSSLLPCSCAKALWDVCSSLSLHQYTCYIHKQRCMQDILGSIHLAHCINGLRSNFRIKHQETFQFILCRIIWSGTDCRFIK